MRNILAKVPHKEKCCLAGHLKRIWMQPDQRSPWQTAAELVEGYGERFPVASAASRRVLKIRSNPTLLPRSITRESPQQT